ncbi:hypothetical protein E2562_014527 [Oryza meyeriana var. granulata]|uniref:Uncharacterized protein n=1 Tax=Oryza meyeriana var. granulata TaxID=110450 RepID=A0A6G1EJY6_9ORYZ|nr:hypothetical protein E2562_014527 [Oryza meyeriana var. granulata]
MGCVASKNAVSVTPAVDSSGVLQEKSLPHASEPAAMVVSVTASSLRWTVEQRASSGLGDLGGGRAAH